MLWGTFDYGNKDPINKFSGFTLNPAVDFNFPGRISSAGAMGGAQLHVGPWGFLPEFGASKNFGTDVSVLPTVGFALSKNGHTNVLSFELSGILGVTREDVESGAIGFSIGFGSRILHNITDKR
jgi:hypothetical protein